MTSCPDCGAIAPLRVSWWDSVSPDHFVVHVCLLSEWVGWTVEALDAELGR